MMTQEKSFRKCMTPCENLHGDWSKDEGGSIE